MDAVILSVGTELVIGQCVDTNSAWLAHELTGMGVQVTRHETVGDDPSRLGETIRSASAADLVILTGGLGPTPDDLTRQAFADAIGVEVRENAAALSAIRSFFERWQRPMPESNRVQALVPEGCRSIPNPRGTAPGILYDGSAESQLERGPSRRPKPADQEGSGLPNQPANSQRRCLLVALPGVPAEMRTMFDASIRPIVAERAGGAAVSEVKLHCFGISEAKLGDALADLMARDRNPLVGTTASQAVLTVRIVARGSNPEEARALAQTDATEVRGRLKHLVFGEGDETLASAVGAALLRSERTVSVAESCTGGQLGGCLTETAGSSRYFLRGYVTYSNEAKAELLGVEPSLIAEHGAVSEPVAAAMARGCRNRAGSDLTLSITGIAGPDGGTPDKPVGLVFIGLADETGVRVQRFLFGEHLTRAEIRDRSCKTALNLLRLRLLGHG